MKISDVKNVYCVGRNYVAHANELGNQVPTRPMLFLKPTHALVEAEGQTILLPGGRGPVHYEVEVVISLARAYEDGLTVDDLIDSMAIGIDFTLRDVQSSLKETGQPWLPAKGFLNSGVLAPFFPFAGEADCKAKDFSLRQNGNEVQRGNISNMIFDLQTILRFVAHNYGLGAGDIIYTGTPAGVGSVASGDVLTMLWNNRPLGDITVELDA